MSEDSRIPARPAEHLPHAHDDGGSGSSHGAQRPPLPHAHDDGLAAEIEARRRRWLDAGWPAPDAVLITGSGIEVDLGSPVAGPWPFAEFLPFHPEPIQGHAGTVEVAATAAGRHLLVSRGRLHLYQGCTPAEVVFLVRLGALLGAGALVVGNAAGSLRRDLPEGSIVAISDHLNLTGHNPLRGQPPAAWGPQFPDLCDAYDADLRRRLVDIGREAGIRVHEGVYVGLLGPSYETPAEIRAYRALGGDLVGMSTVQEVIAARHMGLRVLGFSLVTNMAAGMEGAHLDHEDVLRVGAGAAGQVARLLRGLLDDEELWRRPSSSCGSPASPAA